MTCLLVQLGYAWRCVLGGYSFIHITLGWVAKQCMMGMQVAMGMKLVQDVQFSHNDCAPYARLNKITLLLSLVLWTTMVCASDPLDLQ